jgi:hypothetical protein
MNPQICTIEDDFVRDKPRWVAVLSDKTTVYQDDDRPGLAEPSAWIRLKNHCQENLLHIVQFWLQFRSNRVAVGPFDADGYYFVKSAFGIWGEGVTYHSFVAGTLIDGEVVGAKWKVPELMPIQMISRRVELDSPTIIATKLTNSLR